MRPSDSPEQDAAAAASDDRAQFAHEALENLFAISPDAIFVTDADGVIRGANSRAAELFGRTEAEFQGLPIEELVPERFRSKHPSHRENYHAHPRTRQMGAAMNLYGLRKDGTEFPVDIMLKPLNTSLGTFVLSFVRDVTEQHEAQELARRNDLQLRTLLAGVRDYAIYLIDREGYITTWNPGAQRIKQYLPDEIIGKHFSRFFTHEDVERGRPAELLHLAAERDRIEENFLERAVILTRGSVLYVPLAELQMKAATTTVELERPTLQAAEPDHIVRVLRATKGQIGGSDGAAARLGLIRTTLNSKIKKLGIERSDYM